MNVANNAAFIAASRQALPAALADIEELEQRLLAQANQGFAEGLLEGKIEALEAKLADAVKALEHVEIYSNNPQVVGTARAALAKLKGKA